MSRDFSGFMCTSCHRNKSLRTDVLMFDMTKYNFQHDVIRNVLADVYRSKDANGIEYICKRCHSSLSDMKNPDIPRYSAFRRREEKQKNEEEEDKSYICTSCHDVRYTRKRWFHLWRRITSLITILLERFYLRSIDVLMEVNSYVTHVILIL